MRRNARVRFQMPLGTSSLIMTFAILCMTIFCVLALLTANREMVLAKKSAQNVERYYAADVIAEQITEELIALSRFGEDIPGEINDVALYLSVENGRRIVRFLSPMDDVRAIELGIDCDQSQVLFSRIVRIADWTPDNSIPVWDGVSLFPEP